MRRTARGIAYPSVTYPRGVYPILATEGTHSDLAGGYPVLEYPLPETGVLPTWDGYPTWDSGTPTGRDLGPVTGVPSGKDMGPVEVLWDKDGVTPPPKQTHTCENITSHRTTDAGSNNFRVLLGLIGVHDLP